MRVQTVTTQHYTFSDGDVVVHRISDLSLVVRLLIRNAKGPRPGIWFDVTGENTGLTDRDMQDKFNDLPKYYRYLGNKYEAFQ